MIGSQPIKGKPLLEVYMKFILSFLMLMCLVSCGNDKDNDKFNSHLVTDCYMYIWNKEVKCDEFTINGKNSTCTAYGVVYHNYYMRCENNQ